VAFGYRKIVSAARGVERTVAGAGGKAVATRAEVSKMAGAKRLIDTAVRRSGRIDILFANAGIWTPTPRGGSRHVSLYSRHRWASLV